jgi:formylglycine-generating enzyme required for sulfatase activity
MSSIRSVSWLRSPAFPNTRIAGSVCVCCLAVFLAGCGGGDAPPAPATEPAAAPVQPAAGGPPASAAENTRHDLSRPASGAPQRGRFPRGEGPSGDPEPSGTEADYVILDDPAQGGSVFKFDPAGRESSVDRFLAGASPEAPGSGRFAMPTKSVPSAAAPAEPVRLPDGFKAIVAAGFSPDGFPWRVRCEKDDALLVYVPAGVFLQGKNGSVAEAAPEHAVALDGFYIDLYEVTCAHYEKFRDAARIARRPVIEPARPPVDFQEPVTGVTWAEGPRVCRLVRAGTADGSGMGESGPRPDRVRFSLGQRSLCVAACPESGADRRGRFVSWRPEPLGVFDMAGNAREWCADLFQEQYYAQLVKETGAVSPIPPARNQPRRQSARRQGGRSRVARLARGGLPLADRPVDVGFRCVWRPKPARKRR